MQAFYASSKPHRQNQSTDRNIYTRNLVIMKYYSASIVSKGYEYVF